MCKRRTYFTVPKKSSSNPSPRPTPALRIGHKWTFWWIPRCVCVCSVFNSPLKKVLDLCDIGSWSWWGSQLTPWMDYQAEGRWYVCTSSHKFLYFNDLGELSALVCQQCIGSWYQSQEIWSDRLPRLWLLGSPHTWFYTLWCERGRGKP